MGQKASFLSHSPKVNISLSEGKYRKPTVYIAPKAYRLRRIYRSRREYRITEGDTYIYLDINFLL